MNVEPVCPYEGCGAEGTHYHRKGRTADFCACPCGLCDPDHLDSNDFATRCYAPRPGNAEPETDLSAQVARIRPGDQVTAEFEGVSPVKASGALLSDRDILAAVLLIARGARHLYRASGALIDHMTGPEMVRAARQHWEAQ